jgi:Flp pilus assembly protein TadD
MVTTAALRVFARAACLFACALACVSCTHQVQTSSFPFPVAQGPAVPAAVSREVKNAADAGEGDLELRALRQRLAANAKDLDARMSLARYYSSRNLPDLALEHYRLALAQFPDSPAVTLALAKTLREMGEPSEALRTLREYADRQPRGSWEVLSLTGILEDEQGHLAAAETAHRAAVTLAPEKSELHNNLGYNLLSQKQIEPAINEFRRAIELDPKSEVAHNNLAAALARSGSESASKEALAEWRRSTSLAEAYNNLAAASMEQGRYSEARTQLGIALTLQHDLPVALSNLKLVSEMDGKAADVPVRKRVSLWARIFRSKSAQPADAPTDATEKK